MFNSEKLQNTELKKLFSSKLQRLLLPEPLTRKISTTCKQQCYYNIMYRLSAPVTGWKAEGYGFNSL
jgi:hypothetical protein